MQLDWNLYQLGPYPIHFHATRPNRSYRSEAATRAQRYLYSPRIDWSDRQYLHDPVNVTLKGLLFGNCAFTPLQRVQQLRSIAGRPSDIFAYVDMNCCAGETLCACKSCTVQTSCALAWYMSRGVLTSVEVRDTDNYIMEIELRLQIDPLFRPVHRYLYKWGFGQPDALRSIEPKLPYHQYINSYPQCQSLCECEFCRSWVRIPYRCDDFVYDPDLWAQEGCVFPPNVPAVFQGITWTPVRDIGVISPEVQFGAPPHVLYAFRNIPTSGAITITNHHADGQWSSRKDVTIIDLAATNQELVDKGFSGIQPGDMIYIGDVLKLPGFILRGDTMIDVPRPVVSYSTWTPGGLYPGRNSVDIAAPPNVEFAYRVEFRRF